MGDLPTSQAGNPPTNLAGNLPTSLAGILPTNLAGVIARPIRRGRQVNGITDLHSDQNTKGVRQRAKGKRS